jgi:hypothetical protein
MSMKQNVSSTDGSVRILLGAVAGVVSLAVLASLISSPTILSPVLGVASLILIGTGLTGSCPVYTVLGINTCSASSQLD